MIMTKLTDLRNTYVFPLCLKFFKNWYSFKFFYDLFVQIGDNLSNLFVSFLNEPSNILTEFTERSDDLFDFRLVFFNNLTDRS